MDGWINPIFSVSLLERCIYMQKNQVWPQTGKEDCLPVKEAFLFGENVRTLTLDGYYLWNPTTAGLWQTHSPTCIHRVAYSIAAGGGCESQSAGGPCVSSLWGNTMVVMTLEIDSPLCQGLLLWLSGFPKIHTRINSHRPTAFTHSVACHCLKEGEVDDWWVNLCCT